MVIILSFQMSFQLGNFSSVVGLEMDKLETFKVLDENLFSKIVLRSGWWS